MATEQELESRLTTCIHNENGVEVRITRFDSTTTDAARREGELIAEACARALMSCVVRFPGGMCVSIVPAEPDAETVEFLEEEVTEDRVCKMLLHDRDRENKRLRAALQTLEDENYKLRLLAETDGKVLRSTLDALNRQVENWLAANRWRTGADPRSS